MPSWVGASESDVARLNVDEEQTVGDSLPSSWYRSEAMYSLERRAIFSRKWMLATHRQRFTEPGTFVTFSVAGYPVLLIMNRKNEIKAFHNVCRHRAYPVVEKDEGKVSILACKYHSWSYSLDGNLAKAPKFQNLTDFDKTSNSLFKIHTHEDDFGFVWINLDGAEEPEINWEQDFEAEFRLKQYKFSEYKLDHTWKMLGDFNWKTLSDNYNECYHCPTGHPAIMSMMDSSTYRVETKGGLIQHWREDKGEGLGIVSTFYYPNCSMSASEPFFYIQRCLPISANQTELSYEVYRHRDASELDFDRINQIFKQVLKEDKDLCNAAQKNLDVGIYTKGNLHSMYEKGPLYQQKLTRELVLEHFAREEAAEKQIWPAAPRQNLSDRMQADMDFCAKLDCDSRMTELAW